MVRTINIGRGQINLHSDDGDRPRPLSQRHRPQGGNGWQIPEAGRAEQSPLKPTADVLNQGKSVFGSRCQKCHGPEGKGDGPDSEPEHPAADVTDTARAAVNPDGVLFYKIWNGRKGPKVNG